MSATKTRLPLVLARRAVTSGRRFDSAHLHSLTAL